MKAVRIEKPGAIVFLKVTSKNNVIELCQRANRITTRSKKSRSKDTRMQTQQHLKQHDIMAITNGDIEIVEGLKPILWVELCCTRGGPVAWVGVREGKKAVGRRLKASSKSWRVFATSSASGL
tara:strand:+ start:602 stop:970 length:369 start_codon:yes stop_codon:yes gene_type:complete